LVSHDCDVIVILRRYACDMTFHLAQISDTHLSAEKPFFVGNFMRLAETLNAGRPDLVLNSGDISDGAAHEGDLAEARRLHDTLRLAVRYIPGNHDIGDSAGVDSPHSHPIDGDRRSRYRRYFGADWWLMDVPGWRLLSINAQLVDSELDAAAEQEAFVAEAAATARGRAIALFLHKPMFDRSEDETVVGGRFLNPAPRRRLLAALRARQPAVVACGHVHQYRLSGNAAARHVWAPSTAFVIPDHRQPRYGLKEVGYVAHAFHADGTHDSRFMAVPGVETLNIADFPAAYGPVD
jgi:3',5'-cyclic AMP phosphodiesterase CpdA